MSDSASSWAAALQAPQSSPSPGVCSNFCPLSRWCHPTISPSAAPSPPALDLSRHRVFSSESALRTGWPKCWNFSFNISPSMNIQGGFPLGLASLISLLSRGLSRAFSSTAVWKHQLFRAQPSLWSNSHIHTWTAGKTIELQQVSISLVIIPDTYLYSQDLRSCTFFWSLLLDACPLSAILSDNYVSFGWHTF